MTFNDLPCVDMADRKSLPNCPAVYFIVEGEDVVYVGQTASLATRIRSHHLMFSKQAKVAWFETAKSDLLFAEACFIACFRPKMNKEYKRRKRKPKTEWGRIVFLAGPVDIKRLKALMSKHELSLQYVIRRALYELAVKAKVEA